MSAGGPACRVLVRARHGGPGERFRRRVYALAQACPVGAQGDADLPSIWSSRRVVPLRYARRVAVDAGMDGSPYRVLGRTTWPYAASGRRVA